MPGIAAIIADLERVIADQGFIGLPINLRHGQVAGSLPGPQRDPFDRMLIAQAMLENLVLVSNEQPFDAYGVAPLWRSGPVHTATACPPAPNIRRGKFIAPGRG